MFMFLVRLFSTLYFLWKNPAGVVILTMKLGIVRLCKI